MSNLLTTERLEEIKSGQGWHRLTVRELLAHIEAQADEIAAQKSSLAKLGQWIAALQARFEGGSE